MVAMAGAPDLNRCAEQARLLDIMTEAAKAYAYEASELSMDVGKLQATAYVLRRETVEIVRRKAEQAGEVYMEHREEHGC